MVINICDQTIVLSNLTFNAFYIFVHLYYHFLQVGVGFRQICDWMLWLKRQEETIDWECSHGYVCEIGAMSAWVAFYGLVIDYLGL